jgi:hypothetical protein
MIGRRKFGLGIAVALLDVSIEAFWVCFAVRQLSQHCSSTIEKDVCQRL